MVASFLIPDCLETIFSNLLVKNPNNYIYISTRDIHSCALVSRHWCLFSIPFLYAYPFHHLAFSKSNWNYHYEGNSSYYKLIRTLLSCIPKSEIEQIRISNSFNIRKLLYYIPFLNKNSSPSYSSATFNYIAFIRGIIFDKILLNINLKKVTGNYQKIWLPPYIINDLEDHQFSKVSIPIMKYFVEYLCKHCNNLTTLDFPFAISNDNLSDNIINLLTFSDDNGINNLTNLKELSCIYNEDISRKKGKLPKDLYFALSDSICNLNLLCNERIGSSREANSLSKFISSQKNLKHVKLSENKMISYYSDAICGYYNIVFNSLSTQSESLQVLDFGYLTFHNISREALNSLCLLKNIKVLKLRNCTIDNYLNAWAENLKLEVFEFYDYNISYTLKTFLIQLIRSSSNTLTKLILKYVEDIDDQIVQQVPLYLHSIIHLEIPKVCPDLLTNIFESCTELIYLSATLSDDKPWENCRNLGKFIPKNLQKIRFGYFLLISINEFKFFLEESKNSNRKLKYIEIVNCDIDEYLNVANEFGVELIKVTDLYD
ncbi:hypothetical protein RhiirA5_410665 [Rhizophagus irregularis]|uniref:F-box domain-containing protein n=1 Tax=Rhizophagus irregularis TaxID=588596 RepID=A0A2I1EBA1_9GLOM|nr:hypothetical protein RhiirA5_410665 [Rhizophagus irregularis]PKC73592.1 hypothetical protein RhiirA1_451000 [Rhizophagus irregularis]PKY19390.1 hypothetical protein RhiirB3_432433 [Rhizophagus irregularis]CAB4481327.1 unnamed protein product [Rhizophagus irregularis]CAB5383172.1 unnamed protein product [Rhizophagus irregularis]